MLLVQRFAVLLYLLQFGSAMMIPSSHVLSGPSTSRSPVVPAVRPTVNRRPVVLPRAGIGADFAVKLTLVTKIVKCAHELAKKCVDSYYGDSVSPRPDWKAPAIEFPIDFLNSDDWEFVGFYGTIKQHIDMERSTITFDKAASNSAMQKMGEGFYVSDSIMVAREWAKNSRRECLAENPGTSDVESEDVEAMSSASSDCEYAMCAAFISRKYWAKAKKVIISPKTSDWERRAKLLFDSYLFHAELDERVAVAISYVDRNEDKMEMKFMPQHAKYMHVVCGPDDGAENVERSILLDELERPFAALFERKYYSRMMQFNIGMNLKKAINDGEKEGTWVPDVAGEKPWTDYGRANSAIEVIE
ncbi:hypothetical protein BKA69DRAFT_860065 [Paraphysoderma sedebokerense]|nr:hypothetical protein BKA69DRAFT_860065 [Paraphysoderma sedebokerense]